MNRRRFLAASAVASSTAIAGCLGDEPTASEPADPGSAPSSADGADGDADENDTSANRTDGTDSSPEDPSPDDDSTAADGSFETMTVGGHEIPLVPVETAYDWYEEGDSYFLDARGAPQYEQLHIEDARLSPAREPDFDHPTDDISSDARIVTYCGCPHSLSAARAAELYDSGYTDVYAIDEGLGGWTEKGYPTVDGAADQAVSSYTIRGRTDSTFAGEQVWLFEPDSGQQYVSQIGDDGTFKLAFEFLRVDDETAVSLELPDRTLDGTLGELSAEPLEL